MRSKGLLSDSPVLSLSFVSILPVGLTCVINIISDASVWPSLGALRGCWVDPKLLALSLCLCVLGLIKIAFC